jgi:hypothetical protein
MDARTTVISGQRKVDFFTGSGIRLAGVLDTPADAANVPAVVLCHGPGGVKEQLMPQISTFLCQAGYAVLRFDYRGWGESEGARGRLVPAEQVEDIRSAVAFLGQQPGVDDRRVGVIGLAIGGSNALYAAAFDNGIKCVAVVSAIGDLGRWLRGRRPYWDWLKFRERLAGDRRQRAISGKPEMVEEIDFLIPDPEGMAKYREIANRQPELLKDMRFSLESVEALTEFQPFMVVDRIAPRGILLICAGEDLTVPVSESEDIYRRAGTPRKLVVMEGAAHGELYRGAGLQRVIQECDRWFKEHLSDNVKA